MIAESTTALSFDHAATSPTEAPTAGVNPSKLQQKRDRRKKLQLAAQKRLEIRHQGPQSAAAAAAGQQPLVTTTGEQQRTKRKPRHGLTDLEKRRKKQAKRAARRLKKEFFLDLEKVTAGIAGLVRVEGQEAVRDGTTGMELDA
ncbi:hypothetical protein RB594_000991 [Gaeumannomyces avenae]